MCLIQDLKPVRAAPQRQLMQGAVRLADRPDQTKIPDRRARGTEVSLKNNHTVPPRCGSERVSQSHDAGACNSNVRCIFHFRELLLHPLTRARSVYRSAAILERKQTTLNAMNAPLHPKAAEILATLSPASTPPR